jgi:hypothetical protein
MGGGMRQLARLSPSLPCSAEARRVRRLQWAGRRRRRQPRRRDLWRRRLSCCRRLSSLAQGRPLRRHRPRAAGPHLHAQPFLPFRRPGRWARAGAGGPGRHCPSRGTVQRRRPGRRSQGRPARAGRSAGLPGRVRLSVATSPTTGGGSSSSLLLRAAGSASQGGGGRAEDLGDRRRLGRLGRLGAIAERDREGGQPEPPAPVAPWTSLAHVGCTGFVGPGPASSPRLAPGLAPVRGLRDLSAPPAAQEHRSQTKSCGHLEYTSALGRGPARWRTSQEEDHPRRPGPGRASGRRAYLP